MTRRAYAPVTGTPHPYGSKAANGCAAAGQQRENAESEGKEDTGMSDKSGYVGRIKNGGTQVVKAPNQQTDAKKGVIHTGSDLRTGKK